MTFGSSARRESHRRHDHDVDRVVLDRPDRRSPERDRDQQLDSARARPDSSGHGDPRSDENHDEPGRDGIQSVHPAGPGPDPTPKLNNNVTFSGGLTGTGTVSNATPTQLTVTAFTGTLSGGPVS